MKEVEQGEQAISGRGSDRVEGQFTHADQGSANSDKTASATSQKQFGQWNVVRRNADGRWDLIGSRPSMKAVIRYRNDLISKGDVRGLRICDADGDLYMVCGPLKPLILVPDCDIFDETGGCSERVVL